MARWALKDKHYLNVPGTEWEYKETDRDTGRQRRMVLGVPLYLDPKDSADWNDRANEMIVVTNKYDPAHPHDHVFVGDPTPDMDPMDDEANAISQSFIDRGAWLHPIDSLNMTYSQSILSNLEQQIVEAVKSSVKAAPVEVPNVSASAVTKKQFDDLQNLVKQLTEQNASMQAQLLEVKKPQGLVRRI
jgi:hypothetical protein